MKRGTWMRILLAVGCVCIVALLLQVGRHLRSGLEGRNESKVPPGSGRKSTAQPESSVASPSSSQPAAANPAGGERGAVEATTSTPDPTQHSPVPATATGNAALRMKASQPVGLDLTVDPPITVVGVPSRVAVTVTPEIDAPVLEIEITLPRGVVRIEGATRWEGGAGRGAPQTLSCTVRSEVPGSMPIAAWAAIRFPDGTTCAANGMVVCRVGECPPEAPPSGLERVDPEGNRIIEVPADAGR